jgi:hypothetical protein
MYLWATQMAIAVGEAGLPFEMHDKDAIVAALRGVDDVEVGPGYGQISVTLLRDKRSDAIPHVIWDPLPEIIPITPTQRLRVEHVLRTGTPAGWPIPDGIKE